MNKDQENSDSDRNSQIPSDGYLAKYIKPFEETDSSSKLEQPIESDNEEPVDEDPATGKKFSNGKRWLFLIFLIITISAGSYFYTQENGIDLPITLPSDLNKSFPFAETTPKPFTDRSKTLPIASASKIIESAEKPGVLDKPTSENEKTIDLLRNEIRSLKTALTKKNPSSSQNVRNIITHISGGTIREETKGLIGQEKKESEPEMKVILIPPPSVKAEPSTSNKIFGKETKESMDKIRAEPEPKIQVTSIPSIPVKVKPTLKQNQRQEISPQRSKEVQAYLDFVENTGNKLVRLIKEGWGRFQALIL